MTGASVRSSHFDADRLDPLCDGKLEEWGEIFGHNVMAAALIDRLMHRCHIVNIGRSK